MTGWPAVLTVRRVVALGGLHTQFVGAKNVRAFLMKLKWIV
jgi:hypothetical protein